MLYRTCDHCGARHYGARDSRLALCRSCGRCLTRGRLTEESVRQTLYPRLTTVERVRAGAE